MGSLALPPAKELSQWRFEAWREAATTVVAMQRPLEVVAGERRERETVIQVEN